MHVLTLFVAGFRVVFSSPDVEAQPRALVAHGDALVLAGLSWGSQWSSMQVLPFSLDGVARDPLFFSPTTFSSGLSAAVVDDAGRLWLGGFAYVDRGSGFELDAAVLRLSQDGALDPLSASTAFSSSTSTPKTTKSTVSLRSAPAWSRWEERASRPKTA